MKTFYENILIFAIQKFCLNFFVEAEVSGGRQVFCYALSPPDGSEWRSRIEQEVEHFTDVSSWTVPDIAARISADQIQVRDSNSNEDQKPELGRYLPCHDHLRRCGKAAQKGP